MRFVVMDKIVTISIALIVLAIMLIYSTIPPTTLTEERCLAENGQVKTDNLGQRFCEFQSGAWMMLD